MMDINLQYITFISYFLVPIMGTKIFLRRHRQEMDFSFNTIYTYVLLVVANIPATRLLIPIVHRLAGMSVNEGSLKYMVLAVVSTVIIPVLIEVIEKSISLNVEIQKNEKEEVDNEK